MAACRIRRVAWVPALAAALATACGSSAVPDPKPVVSRYAEAVRRGDAAAVYGLLTPKAQRSLGRAGVAKRVAEERAELTAQAQALTSKQAQLEMRSQLRFVDGEFASFTIEEGEFRLQAVSALPARATTPEMALAELRAVLARRSYAGLTRVLTQESALGLEEKLQSLVTALQNPDQLEIRIEAERAIIELPHGHRVELQKEEGVWKVHDFE